jgi:hypothetical protein
MQAFVPLCGTDSALIKIKRFASNVNLYKCFANKSSTEWYGGAVVVAEGH